MEVTFKEVRLRPKIGSHDYAWKKDRLVDFLQRRSKVKLVVLLRGRERERPDVGRALLQRMADDVKEFGHVEGAPEFEGRSIAFVESCRDEHLASLDADDGLAVLGIGWQEVVRRLGERDRERVSRGSRKCPRCGDRMVERRLRQTKRRHPPGEHFRRVAGSPEYRVYRCVACGLVQKP